MKAKKLLALLLCLVLLGSALPVVAVAQEITETTEETTAYSIHDVLKVGAEGEYSTVYYGGIPWRVLDKQFSDGQAVPTNGIYLLSEYVYGYGTYWNAHYGPGDYVWNRTGIYTRLDVLYHPDGYQGNASNKSPTNLGYQASDIRKYMTGIGDYEPIFTRSMHEHGNPDNSGLNVSSYFEKIKVTYSEPIPGVVYYVKGDFRLSTDEMNNYQTLAVTAADWLPDTWYTYDAATDSYNLVEEAPAEGVTLTCYHDASEYYPVGELTSFDAGVTYYTFEKISADDDRWAFTKLEMQSNSIAKGALYCAFSVTDMKNSTSVDTEGEGRVILSGTNNRNFATDMGFSLAEQAAVLPTNRTGYTNGAAKAPSVWTYKNSAAYSDELVGDTYFLPTAADLNTYLDDRGVGKVATFANGDPAQYWLSSMTRYDRIGMVDSGGGEWYQHPTFKSLGIRPAFNLNPNAVVMYTAVEGMENTYKMTLADATRKFALVSAERNGDTLTVSYTGALVGENEYLSYILKNKVTGEIVKYGTLGAVTAESATLDIDVSSIDTLTYDMYLFNEQINGETESNYASTLQRVEYELADYTLSLTTDKTALKATESLNATVSIDGAYYSAEYTLTYDVAMFSCAADADNDGVIYVKNLYKGEAGALATYTLVAKNDIDAVSFGNILSVDGNVIQFKEQLVSDMENTVMGDAESIRVSLNYTAAVRSDFVPGYSLVLVRGDDAGYAYNGVKMFYVEAYGAYAFLVEGAVTAEEIDLAISKTGGCESIAQSYDVNAEFVADGLVDLKDATAVFACSVVDFNITEYMELYLRADVNGDCFVNMIDVNAVASNYTK